MLLRAVAVLALLAAAGLARAGEVTVAVAANFAGTMQEIAKAFERDTGHRALLAVGSTGRFYAQILAHAPFQVLLAADSETPARLEREGWAVAGSRFTYATGRLVLWSATPGVVDEAGAVLRRPGTAKIAIADPKLAPYGAAAVQAMQHLGVAESLRPRLVQAENIGQAWQFVSTGNALLGFVALSQVMRGGRIGAGSAWVVPEALHDPLRQDAVLLDPGKDNAAARALLAYLRTDTARGLMRAHGYGS